jgi:FKBP-type peptidyl-prolyl cis-trans isomerase
MKKNPLLTVALASLCVSAFGLSSYAYAAEEAKPVASPTTEAKAVTKPETKPLTKKDKMEKSTPNYTNAKELMKNDLKVGDGTTATNGKMVTVHYTGWLPSATNPHDKKFDSSLDHGSPFQFKLGAGQVIQGWDQGVAGMKINGKRELVIPPQLGYGARGAGAVIPPNATLVFEVELLKVE